MRSTTSPSQPADGSSAEHRPGPAARRWQPDSVNRLIRIAAWLMLLAQAGIIVTGAIVRLTGSGLGCPTWPMCTDESLVNTPEMGIHGIIEFGNRLLGVGLGVLGVATLLMLWRMRTSRRDLFWMAFALTAVVPFQALLGGLTVHMELNPWIVAAHFLPSVIAVGVSAVFVRRTYDSGRDARAAGTGLQRGLAWTIGVLTAVVVLLGILTTGAGPHAGDEISARNGFDLHLMARLHAIPVWPLVGATVLARLLAGGLFSGTRLREVARTLDVLILVLVYQGAVGYIQYHLALPIVLVALHIVGVGLVVAAATAVIDAHYPRSPIGAGASTGAGSTSDRGDAHRGDAPAAAGSAVPGVPKAPSASG